MRKIREARLHRGLTIDDLFFGTGIDRASISRLERGGTHPSPEQRAILSKFYGIPEDELFPEYEGLAPEYDRGLFRQLKKLMTMEERLFLLARNPDYSAYRTRLLELAKKYGLEV